MEEKAFINIDCPICDLIVHRDLNETYIADFPVGNLFLHHNQIYKGRVFLAYCEHITDLSMLNIEKFNQFNYEVLIIYRMLRKIFKPELINIALLGNKIRHTHWHLIPRYVDDPNWGSAPWPYPERVVDNDNYLEVISLIRNELGGQKNGQYYKIPE